MSALIYEILLWVPCLYTLSLYCLSIILVRTCLLVFLAIYHDLGGDRRVVFVACVRLGLCHVREHACIYVFVLCLPSPASVDSEFAVIVVFIVSEHISPLSNAQPRHQGQGQVPQRGNRAGVLQAAHCPPCSRSCPVPVSSVF